MHADCVVGCDVQLVNGLRDGVGIVADGISQISILIINIFFFLKKNWMISFGTFRFRARLDGDMELEG